MADGESQWRLLLKTVSDLTGFKQTEQGLDVQRQKVEALTRATKELEAVNRQARASSGLATSSADLRASQYEFVGPEGNQRLVKIKQQAKDVSEEVAKDVERISVSTRGLGSVVSRFGALLGGFAGLGRAVFNPISLFLVGAIDLTMKWLEHSKQVLEIQESIVPSAESLVHLLRDQAEALSKSAMAAEEYNLRLTRTLSRPETVDEVYNRKLQLAQIETRAEMALADAKYAREKADLESFYATGFIGYTEYLRRKTQLDLDYERQKGEMDKAALDAQENLLKTKQGVLTSSLAAMRGRGGPLEQASAAAASTGAIDVGAQQRYEKSKKELDETNAQKDKLNADILARQDAILDGYELKLMAGNVDAAKKLRDAGGEDTVAETQRQYERAVNIAFANDSQLNALKDAFGDVAQRITPMTKVVEENRLALDAANKANEEATSKLEELRQEADQLTASLHAVNAEIKTTDIINPQKKAAIDANVAAQAKKIQDDLIIKQEAKERAAGINIGGTGSSLRYTDPRAAAAFFALSEAQRQGRPIPGVEFNPASKDAATGLPVNPAAPRPLQPWEGTYQQRQDQYNKERYPGYDPLPAIKTADAAAHAALDRIATQINESTDRTTAMFHNLVDAYEKQKTRVDALDSRLKDLLN